MLIADEIRRIAWSIWKSFYGIFDQFCEESDTFSYTGLRFRSRDGGIVDIAAEHRNLTCTARKCAATNTRFGMLPTDDQL